MLERIDPILHRGADALPVAAGGGRRSGGHPGQRQSPRAGPSDDAAQAATPIDTTLARLAALIADVERLARTEETASSGAPARAGDVAAQIAGDGATALAAQAGLGPAGVRLVLDADRAGPEPK